MKRLKGSPLPRRATCGDGGSILVRFKEVAGGLTVRGGGPLRGFALAGAAIKLQKKRQGLEGGLDLPRFARAMSREMFIKPEEGALSLGMTPDDIDAAIAQSARASADALDGKARLVGMQGEKT